MVVQFLGLIDVLISVLLGLTYFGISLKFLFIIAGIYLLGKGILFITSLASIIDIAAGILLILGYFFTIPSVLFIIIGVLLLQKGIFSFL